MQVLLCCFHLFLLLQRDEDEAGLVPYGAGAVQKRLGVAGRGTLYACLLIASAVNHNRLPLVS